MMATHLSEDGVDQEPTMPSADEIQSMMVAKAHELFAVCDKEEKGFITKRDMQRLQTELPLSPEQLESVFDSLDDDGNGFLTLEEFTGGFGSFLGMTPTVEKQESFNSSHGSEKVYENEHINSEDDEENFSEMIETLGASGVFDDIDVIKCIWSKIRRDEPELLGNFEEFLGRVTGEIKRSHTDLSSLESALRNKSVSHDEEVRKLYEEMEQQIRAEKERILAEEKARERQLREEMEKELIEKERLLKDMIARQQEMEEKLTSQNSTEVDVKLENDRLMKEKEELERLLDQTQGHLEESKSYINTLRQKQRDEKRERAMAALQISEGIAMERESLVKQLDMLRDMNKKLRDDRDEKELQRENSCLQMELTQAERASNYYTGDLGEEIEEEKDSGVDKTDGASSPASASHLEGASPSKHLPREQSSSSEAPGSAHKDRRKQLAKQGSVLSNYFGSGPRGFSESGSLQPSVEEDDDIETDDFDPSFNNNNNKQDAELIAKSDFENLAASQSGSLEYRANHSSLTMMKRGEPVGANSSVEVREPPVDPSKLTPERVFKVVFVGDSGVGKSSFIHRFCNDAFKEAFSATIGVDFQVRNLMVDDHLIALQLWDTAGQERFRSITKQYFRKADGVLVMYDVNSEVSFTNVRNWIGSVQEGVEEGTVLVLIGNKTDLCEDEEQRVVKTKEGARMADEYGSLFYEASAKNGSNVTEALRDMASLLREREDREMEKALSLRDGDAKKKGGCCS